MRTAAGDQPRPRLQVAVLSLALLLALEPLEQRDLLGVELRLTGTCGRGLLGVALRTRRHSSLRRVTRRRNRGSLLGCLLHRARGCLRGVARRRGRRGDLLLNRRRRRPAG